MAGYLDTEIGHQIVFQVADARQVTVTPQQLADARTALNEQISSVMSEILQTTEGQNPRYSCSITGQPVTGQEVLATMPSAFVDAEVQFDATTGALEEDLAGVGSSPSALAGYFAGHHTQFDTGCFDAAEFSSESATAAAAAAWPSGRPFLRGDRRHEQRDDPVQRVDHRRRGAGGARERARRPLGRGGLRPHLPQRELPHRATDEPKPTPYAEAEAAVAQAVQQAGSSATQRAVTVAERASTVSVDPRYGVWVPVQASVFTPFSRPRRTC